MPEYLSPGVYVEEVPSTRQIEGVSTTVTGFIGPTRFGPVVGDPELLTSYLDFSRIFCGVDQLNFANAGLQDNFMAHAVRSFFDNGGTKVYVTRAFTPTDPQSPNSGKASSPVGSLPNVTLRARFPGAAGNMQIRFAIRTSPNLLVPASGGASGGDLRGVGTGDLVFLKPGTSSAAASGLYVVNAPGASPGTLQGESGSVPYTTLDPAVMRVHRITLTVLVKRAGLFETEETWSDLSPNPHARNAVTSFFTTDPPSREMQLTIPFAIETTNTSFTGADLVQWLFGARFIDDTLSLSLATTAELQQGSLPGSLPPLARPTLAQLQSVFILTGGNDGNLPTPEAYTGQEASRDSLGNVTPASGLETFADIDEISIVAAPGFTFNYNANPGRADTIAQELIEHCEIRMK